MYASLVDETPITLRDEPATLSALLPAGIPERMGYAVLPRERGNTESVNYSSVIAARLGSPSVGRVVPLAQTVCVLPDLMQAKDQALYLIRSRQIRNGEATAPPAWHRHANSRACANTAKETSFATSPGRPRRGGIN